MSRCLEGTWEGGAAATVVATATMGHMCMQSPAVPDMAGGICINEPASEVRVSLSQEWYANVLLCGECTAPSRLPAPEWGGRGGGQVRWNVRHASHAVRLERPATGAATPPRDVNQLVIIPPRSVRSAR